MTVYTKTTTHVDVEFGREISNAAATAVRLAIAEYAHSSYRFWQSRSGVTIYDVNSLDAGRSLDSYILAILTNFGD